MKTKYKKYIIKVDFWGDSTTPVYRYRVYLPRKILWPLRVWSQNIHRDNIKGKLTDEFEYVIDCYNKERERWKR